MRAVNIKEAKAHLNELVDAATKGEQVVLMRGSKHMVLLTPISEDEIYVVPQMSDAQAEHLRQVVAEQEKRPLIDIVDEIRAEGAATKTPRRRARR